MFKKGQIAWNKGRELSEETKNKISESKKGTLPWNTGTKGLVKPWNKGLKQQTNTGKTHFKKNQAPWNKGEKHLQIENEKHPMWKGDDVGYCGLHIWVKRHLGASSKCEKCGKEFTGRQIHWANKDHTYKRNLEDWIRLCASCHQKYDIENNNYKSVNRL